MNTLTQQQINKYQWQVANGVARIVSRNAKEMGGLLMVPGPAEKEAWKQLSERMKLQTNAPDGIYSGEAFKISKQDFVGDTWMDREVNPWNKDNDLFQTRPFLRLKPSHLPAVLTTQPVEEWKDRYRPWATKGEDRVYIAADESIIEYLCHGYVITWHLITPPAEQEAETVEQAANKQLSTICITDASKEAIAVDFFELGAEWQLEQLQSTLTQKDQRVAELERLLSKVEGYLVISNKSCKDRGERIAELEREWISVNEFDESTLPIVGKSVIGIVDFITSGKEARDYIICYIDEEKQTRLLADDDYYGWDFDECIVKWTYLDMPLKPIF